ncbi:hypothetical protein LCGC14_1974960 [marine sediment metagenome]|uniref:Uncharacterized protein n=1 Tax=marine sediment metagenome TaxID=412755 RepID=A0A0F9I7N8_9ZZZZ
MIQITLVEHTLPRNPLGQYKMLALPSKHEFINFTRDGYVWSGRVFSIDHYLHLKLDPSVTVVVSHVHKVS